jgi:hypothetical protein
VGGAGWALLDGALCCVALRCAALCCVVLRNTSYIYVCVVYRRTSGRRSGPH